MPWRLRAGAALIMAGFALLAGHPAEARQESGFRPRSLTFSAGIAVNGGVPLGDVTARLRSGTTAPPLVLVDADARLQRAIGLEARATLGLTRAVAVEVAGGYARPRLEISVVQDFEGASGAVVAERLAQYAIGGAVLYRLPFELAARARPYVIAGAAYRRELHEDRTAAENGRSIHGGAGLFYRLRGGERRNAGARVELTIVHRARGIRFQERGAVHPALGVFGFVGF
jgi:hypothetical protein